MSDSGWIHHPNHGHVYQPALSKAKTDVHADLDRWHGEDYDVLAEMLDRVAYTSARETLVALLDVTANSHPGAAFMIRAMLRTIDRQQHGTADESGDES